MKVNVKAEPSVTPRSSASVVDGKLILSLPDAAVPAVWQMDMDEAKSSALEVQEDKKSKQFVLNLKKADGTAAQIAPFDDRESAVAALMAASNALASAHGKIRPGASGEAPVIMTAAAPAPKKRGSAAGGAILAAFLIVLLLLFWTVSISLKGADIGPSSVSGAPSSPGQGGLQAGVPLSADDFLRNR